MQTVAPSPRLLLAGYIPSTATITARLRARDGQYYVGRIYHADAGSAALARRVAAARLRSDALRGVPRALGELRALLRPLAGESRPGMLRLVVDAPTCVWCRRAIPADVLPETLGGRPVHPACALAFDVLMAGRD